MVSIPASSKMKFLYCILMLFVLNDICESHGKQITTSDIKDGKLDSLSLASLVAELLDKQTQDRIDMQEMKNTVMAQDRTINTLMGQVSHLQTEKAKSDVQMSSVQTQLNVVADIDWTVTEVKDKQEKLQQNLRDLKNIQSDFNDRVKAFEIRLMRESERTDLNSRYITQIIKDVHTLKTQAVNRDVKLDETQAKLTEFMSKRATSGRHHRKQPQHRVTTSKRLKIFEEGSGSEEEFLPVAKKEEKSDSVVESLQKKLLNQEQDVMKLRSDLTNVTMLMMKLENEVVRTKQKVIEDNVESVQKMFLNVTQQILSLQQWHIANSGHVNGTEMNRRQIESLMQSIAFVKEKLKNLFAVVGHDKKTVNANFRTIRENIRSLNKTSTTNERELRQHTNLALQLQNMISSDFKKLESRAFAIDNRLAHVEVKVLNASLFECKKQMKDNDQDAAMGKLSYRMSLFDGRVRRLAREQKDQRNYVDKVKNNTNKMGNTLGMMIDLSRNLTKHLPDVIDTKVELNKFVRHLPKDCSDVLERTGIKRNGAQLIRPGNSEHSVETYCELEDANDWTYIQRRIDGSVDFAQDWVEYKFGFGDPSAEFWIGNEYLHWLTAQDQYMLYIGLWDVEDVYTYAIYDSFFVDDEKSGFRLNVTGYHGNATDAFSYSTNMQFSTLDRDNDASSTHCGKHYTSGWWYKHCHYSNLNGRFNKGIVWFNYDKEEWVELKHSEMKIKRNHQL
ncbi:uncharacterized protein LOC141909368 [Tubulanus polymorphus]|uniref:uncharacterized protein LOC141909368 n=1 Tax=Tubulanus polymorphus TaxID=672921 RepID=UPI003DA2A8A7